MRSLEQRLEKLEQAYTPAEVEVLMLTDWVEIRSAVDKALTRRQAGLLRPNSLLA